MEKVKQAIEDRKGPLSYGLDYACKRLESVIAKGIKIDPRFLDRSEKEIADNIKERQSLEQWLATFKAECGELKEAETHIARVEAIFVGLDKALAAVNGQLLVEKAIADRKGKLEYGLNHCLERFNKELGEGFAIDPRFPERTTEKLKKMSKTRDDLTEWLQVFVSTVGQYPEAAVHVAAVEQALAKFSTATAAAEGPQAVQAAIDDRKGPLEYGLDHACKALESTLKDGIVLEERFPERFHEKIKKTEKQRDQLVEWLEKFKAECGKYEAATPHITRCETILTGLEKLLASCVGKAAVQTAIDDRKGQLEYGLDYACKQLEGVIKEGIVLDERFPERYHEKVTKTQAQKDKLVEWLAQFTANCGQYEESKTHITRCETIFTGLESLLGAAEGKGKVQKAIDDRSGPLEYGLDYACKQLESTITKGLEIDPRFPERIEKELADTVQRRDKLAEWLESFKSNCGQYSESAPHITRAETVINGINSVVSGVEGKVTVQRAIDDRKGPLEYGLDYACKQLESTTKEGIQIDPRFPERAAEEVDKTVKRRDQLSEWFENFKSSCGRFKEAEVHMDRCYVLLKDVETLLAGIQGKMAVQKAIDDRKGPLEYGLDFHLKKLNGGLDSGFEIDPRFPERSAEKLQEMTKARDQLAEWLENFKSECGTFVESEPYVTACNDVLEKFTRTTAAVVGDQAVRKAIDDRKGPLEYGLDYACKQLESTITKGLEIDPRFPERIEKELADAVQQRDKLAEWLESFRSDCGQYSESAPHIARTETVINGINTVINGVEGKVVVQRAIANRTASLEYGLAHHLERFVGDLKQGIEIDPRFPERAFEKVEKLSKMRDQLAEFLESFRAECSKFPESKSHLVACEEALILYGNVTDSVIGKLAVQKAIDDRKGSLEYGLEHALKGFNDSLDKGIPDDARFPEKGQATLDSLRQQKDKLSEWLESFKAQNAQYQEAYSYISSVTTALDKYEKVVSQSEGKLRVRAAIEARGVLPYGLDYQLKQLNGELAKGLVLDPRFPERAFQALDTLRTQHDQLREFYEAFQADCGNYQEAKEHLVAIENTTKLFVTVTEGVAGTLAVERAVSDRTGPLEYGLDHACKKLEGTLKEGVEVDARFPERGEQKLATVTQQRDKLAEWLENFRATCGQFKESLPHCVRVEAILNGVELLLLRSQGKFTVQRAINDRTKSLEYGLTHHLDKFNKLLEEGIQIDPRFPERAFERLDSLTKMRDQLAEFLEGFRAECAKYDEAKTYLDACDGALTKFEQVTRAVVGKLAVQKAVDSRVGPLEYGFDHAIKRLDADLKDGIPDDPRFPEKGQAKLDAMHQKHDKLNEWLQAFIAECGHFPEAGPYIQSCEKTFTNFATVVSSAEGKLKVRAAIERRGVLPYGLNYQLKGLEDGLGSSLQVDPRFPELAEQKVASLTTMRDQLVEFLETFQTECGQYAEAAPHIRACEQVLDKFQAIIEPALDGVRVQKLIDARTILPYGLKWQLERLESVCAAGIPDDARFPERAAEKVTEVSKMRDQLVEFEEAFKSECSPSMLALAQQHLQSIDNVLSKIAQVTADARLHVWLRAQLNDRSGPLEYGWEYHANALRNATKQGIPTGVAAQSFVEKYMRMADQLNEWLMCFRGSELAHIPEAKSYVTNTQQVLDEFNNVVSSAALRMRVEAAIDVRNSTVPYGIVYARDQLSAQLAKGLSSDGSSPDKDLIFVNSVRSQSDNIQGWLEGFRAEFVDKNGTLPQIAQSEADRCEAVLQQADTFVSSTAGRLKVQSLVNERNPALLEYGLNHALEALNSLLKEGVVVDPRFPEAAHSKVAKAQTYRDRLAEFAEKLRAEATNSDGLLVVEAQAPLQTIEESLRKFELVMGTARIRLEVSKRVADRTGPLPYGLQYHLDLMNGALDKGLPVGDAVALGQAIEKATAANDRLLEWAENFRAEFNVTGSPEVDEVLRLCSAASEKHTRVVGASYALLQAKKAKAEAGGLQHSLSYHLGLLSRQLDTGPVNDERFPERDQKWADDCELLKNQLSEWFCGYVAAVGDISTLSNDPALEEIRQTKAEVEGVLSKADQVLGAISTQLLLKKFVNTKDDRLDKQTISYVLSLLEQHLSRGFDETTPERVINDATKLRDSVVEWFDEFRVRFIGNDGAVRLWADRCEKVLKTYDAVVGASAARLLIKRVRNARKSENSACCLEYGIEWHLNHLVSGLDRIPQADKLSGAALQAVVEPLTQERDLLVEWLEWFRAETANFPAVAQPTIQEVNTALGKYESTVGALWAPVSVAKALEARSTDSKAAFASPLEYGFEFHYTQLHAQLKATVPSEARSLKDWIKTASQRRQQLEAFAALLTAEFFASPAAWAIAKTTVDKCNSLFVEYDGSIGPLQLKLLVANYRAAKKEGKGLLPHGFDYEVQQLVGALDKDQSGAINIAAVSASADRLAEWLEIVRGEVAKYSASAVSQCQLWLDSQQQAERALKAFDSSVALITIPQAVAKFIKKGGALAAGLDFHQRRLNVAAPPEEKDAVKIHVGKSSMTPSTLAQLTQDANELRTFLESFRVNFGKYQATVIEVDTVIKSVSNSLAAFDASVGLNSLEIELKHFLEKWSPSTPLPRPLKYFLDLFESRLAIPLGPEIVVQGNCTMKGLADLLIDFQERFQARFGHALALSELAKTTNGQLVSVLQKWQDQQPYNYQQTKLALKRQRKAGPKPVSSEQPDVAVAVVEEEVKGDSEDAQVSQDGVSSDARAGEEDYYVAAWTMGYVQSRGIGAADVGPRHVSVWEAEEQLVEPPPAMESIEAWLAQPLIEPPPAELKELPPLVPLLSDGEVAAAKEWVKNNTEATVDASGPNGFLSSLIADLPKKSQALAATLKLEEFNATHKVSAELEITVDVSFLSQAAYTDIKDDAERKKVGQAIPVSLLSRFVTSSDGLVGFCNKPPITRLLFLSRVRQIVLGFSGSKSAGSNAPADKQFVTSTPAPGVLVITFSMKGYDAIDPKPFHANLDKLLVFEVPKAIAALRAKLELTGKTLSTRLKRTGSPIVVTMDLEKLLAEISRLAEANQLPGLMKDPKEQVVAAERMVAACNSIVVGTPQSIADQCSKVQPLNNRVFSTLRHIEFVVDTTNTVTCTIGILEVNDDREKGLHLRLRFDEARGVLEITGRYATLYEACKNKPVEAEYLNVGEKAEGAWPRVSALKCMQAGAPKMKGYSGLAKRELGGKNVEYCAAWHEWVDDPTFLQFIPSENQIASNFLVNGHMSRCTNGEDGLFTVWRRGPNIQNAIKSKLDRMVFAFLPNDGPTPGRHNPSMTSYKILFDYHTRTMYVRGRFTAPEWVQGGGKRFRAAGPSYKGWEGTNVRFWQLFEVIDERIRGEKKVWGLKKKFAPIDFYVSYDDFFNDDGYLGNNQRVEITRRVADEHLAAIRRCVTDTWGTKIGREALLKQVKRVVMKFGSSYSWKLNKETQEWVLNVPYSQLLHSSSASSLVKPWQLRWDLGVAVEVAVATAEKVAAKHHRECEKLCRKKFGFEIDWSAVIQRTPEGVTYNDPSLSPEQIIETIVQFGEQLTHRVMLTGLAGLMSCPASAAVVESTIQALRFVLVSTSQRCSPLKIISLANDKHTIVATVDANSVHFGTMTERFQEVLEWHYDVSHACNTYKVDKFRAETVKVVQQECKVSGELFAVNWSEFLSTPEFHTDLHPPKQADIIMALHAHLPTLALTATPCAAQPTLDSSYKHATNSKAMKSLAEQLLLTGRKQKTVKVLREGGLISLMSHTFNLAALRQFNSKTPFFSVRISTEKGSTIPTEGMLLVENGGFVLLLHLDNVLSCLCVDNWRERFASALGTLEETFAAENDEPFAFAKAQVIAKLKAPKLQILTDWVPLRAQSSYMALHPTERTGVVMKYHNNMATSSLLGDSGLTGDFSVGEHAEVAQAIAKAVDTIVFRVVPLESKGLDVVQYEKSNKTLTINYAFMQPLAQSTHIMQGVGYAFEKIFELYPLRLKLMAAAIEKRLAKDVWPVQDKQHKVPFTIDWESFATCDGAFPNYSKKKLAAYWSERVRSVAKCIEDCVTHKTSYPDGEGWGVVGIATVLSETANPGLCQAFDEKCPKGILFRGCEQRQPHNYGKTYLTPRSLDVAVKDGYFVITQDPSRTGQYGAGRMIEFGLRGTAVMQQEEDKVRTRLAAYERDIEKDKRRQENEQRRYRHLPPIDFGPFPDYYGAYAQMAQYHRYDEPCLFAIMDSTAEYRWTVDEFAGAVEWGPERYWHASDWKDSRGANMTNRVATQCQLLMVSNEFVKRNRLEQLENERRKEREALKAREKEAEVERRRQEKVERAARFAESNPFDQKTDPLAYKYWDV